ncbi:MAG: CHAD domain-containing protein [Planctomycetota bacterium]|mgnify:CR=1 FL=1|nr:CHAD domain-containing protein [Planctomycetota bacterium]MDA1252774.1 CHAD domain-containing protein [Planctomycetota bacterium]
MAFRLKRTESVPAGIRRIVREELDAGLAELRVAELRVAEVDRENAVHQVRKRCKRIRSVLRLVRPAIGDQYADETERFRDIGRQLSEMRDADVIVEELDRLRRECGRGKSRRALATLHDEVSQRRAARRSRTKKDHSKLHAVASQFEEARRGLKSWNFSRRGWQAIAGGLRHSCNRSCRALAAIHSEPSDIQLHELRKRVKDQWYQMRILEPVWPAVMRTRCHEMKSLTELLGEDHDLVVVQQAMAESPAMAKSPDLRNALSHLIIRLRKQLRSQSLRIARQLFAENGQSLERRLHAHWKIWRRG